MLRYAITDRTLLTSDPRQQPEVLLQQIAAWASPHRSEPIHFIQLREKDLSPAKLSSLTRQIITMLRTTASSTRLLLNASSASGHGIDIALAGAAHGVHLTSTTFLSANEVRARFTAAGLQPPILTVSCHTLAEVEAAHQQHLDAILFAPVFQKNVPNQTLPGIGLTRLHEACRLAVPTPVLALGGITPQNTQSCLDAGAAGIAAIRLFCTSPSE